jgi:hypothetical protein
VSAVTDLRSRRGWQPDCAALARNRVAMARSSSGLSPAEFAALLEPLLGRAVTPGHVLSWETSATPPGDVLIASDTVSPSPAQLGLRSHKFICAHIGAGAAAALAGRQGMAAGSFSGLECHSEPLPHPSGPCILHVWPWGSAVFHLTEDIEVSGVAALAAWRVRTYAENLDWATRMLSSLAGDGTPAASYVLSAYWVQRPIWAGRLLGTGMRLLCRPRVLLDRDNSGGSAEEAERALLADGYEDAGMRSFGMHGVSEGYASWSGVSYYPADDSRALGEDELVAAELALQPVWAYCDYVNGCAERGEDPEVPDGYGYRFLRAARSRLTSPRSQEPGQHQAMRESIAETSGLPGIIAQAIEGLREDGRP